ncbi:hypothetical protein X975_09029, partial [Stegodyphus mimosarum]
MDEKLARKRIDSLFGDRRKYLVVCEGGVFLHTDKPDHHHHHHSHHDIHHLHHEAE